MYDEARIESVPGTRPPGFSVWIEVIHMNVASRPGCWALEWGSDIWDDYRQGINYDMYINELLKRVVSFHTLVGICGKQREGNCVYPYIIW